MWTYKNGKDDGEEEAEAGEDDGMLTCSCSSLDVEAGSVFRGGCEGVLRTVSVHGRRVVGGDRVMQRSRLFSPCSHRFERGQDHFRATRCIAAQSQWRGDTGGAAPWMGRASTLVGFTEWSSQTHTRTRRHADRHTHNRVGRPSLTMITVDKELKTSAAARMRAAAYIKPPIKAAAV